MKKSDEIKPGDLVRLHHQRHSKGAVEEWGVGIFVSYGAPDSHLEPAWRDNKVYWLAGRHPGFHGYNALNNLEKVP